MRANRLERRGFAFAVLTPGLFFASLAAAQPANDNFANAVAVGSVPFEDHRDVFPGTNEVGEPQPSCDISRGSLFSFSTVWYRFAPQGDVALSVSTVGSNFDSILAVYTGQSFENLREVGCNDTVGEGETLNFFARVGETYYVQIGIWGGPVGPVSGLDGSDLSFFLTTLSGLYDRDRIEPFAVNASDGTALRGHVHIPFPTQPDEKFAVVLYLSPYWNTQDGPSDAQAMPTSVQPFMDAGFAVALVNVRGTGESDGCFQWFSQLDWSDAYAVVEALASKPWSNGRVGMYGLSYAGLTQYMAVSASPPSLKAIVPVSGIVDLWGFATRHGAVVEALNGRPTLFDAGIGLGIYAALSQSGAFVPDTGPSHATCPRYVADVMNEAPVWNGDRTSHWEERDLRSHIAGTDVAVFATSGLVNYKGIGADASVMGEGSIRQVDGIWNLLGQDRRLLLGQWFHDFPTRPDFPQMAVAWFDRYLRDGPTVVQPGIVLIVSQKSGLDTAKRIW